MFVQLNENTYLDERSGIVLERDMHMPRHTMIRSIHNIPRLNIANSLEAVLEKLMKDCPMPHRS